MIDIDIKELTKLQKQKADKITQLIIELKKSGVYPIVIDGGGGSGIEFVRCKDMKKFGEIILDGEQEERNELRDYIYSPEKYYEYSVDYMTP